MKTNLTPYQDINEVLTQLSERLNEILGEQLVGLYLTGSLTYGDFDYGSSDIDFLAVLEKKLTKNQLGDIKKMHDRVGNIVPYWTKRLEGSYITYDMLKAKDRPNKARPYVNAGKIRLLPYGNEWTINLQALYDNSIAIVGPKPKKIFPKVTAEEVRDASRKDLLEEWLPKLNDPKAFTHPDYDSQHLKAYAVLTMCRILYRSKNNGVAAKRTASNWVKKTYGTWSNLVERAENWQHGQDIDTGEKVKDFIRFTYNQTLNIGK